MDAQPNKHEQPQQAWEPPTPRSTFVPLPATTLPVDHLVLLPPPLLAHDNVDATSNGATAGVARPTLPSLRATFNSPAPASAHTSASQQIEDEEWLPSSSTGKRPRRSAAIAAARNLPHQPSPFDLEDDDPSVEEPSPSASPPPAASSPRAAGAAGSSKRKVSHSLIERRRREKINQCLQVLRETVPSLKEEGERKMARARERGRKRGRGDDAGERGGLHKLEILEVSHSLFRDETFPAEPCPCTGHNRVHRGSSQSDRAAGERVEGFVGACPNVNFVAAPCLSTVPASYGPQASPDHASSIATVDGDKLRLERFWRSGRRRRPRGQHAPPRLCDLARAPPCHVEIFSHSGRCF